MGRLSTVPHDSLNTSKEAYMVCIPPRCCFRGNGPNRTALNRIRAKWVIVAGPPAKAVRRGRLNVSNVTTMSPSICRPYYPVLSA